MKHPPGEVITDTLQHLAMPPDPGQRLSLTRGRTYLS